MANLPDIDTSQVGIIAFWNAEDHKTAGAVDPTDCTGVFTNYSVYDNGLDGYKTLGSGRHFNCRVKNDGWCAAWVDRTNTFGYPNKVVADFGESGYKGYYDVLWNWLQNTTIISSTLTTLSYIISLFEAALETSGNFTFSSTDVGHYCYEFTNANVITISDYHIKAPNWGLGTHTGHFQYTTGTIVYHAASVGCGWANCSNNVQLYFDSNHVLYSGSTASATAADVIANGWIPTALTDYPIYHEVFHNSRVHGSLLVIWS